MAKHLKMINLVAVLAATSCAANTPKEVNANPINDISAGDKINIVPTVFTNNMIDLGEMQYALTQGDIINALYINANDNFKDVVNELDIIGPTLENSVYTYTATARASSRTYNGSVTLTYTLTAKTDIATLVTDKTLYPDRATSGWKTLPTTTTLLKRVKELNTNVNINQLVCDTSVYHYDLESGLYYFTVTPNPNSTIYTGSCNVYFALYEQNVQGLGATVFYEGEDNPPTFEDNQIILHKNGWYNIRQDSEVDDKLLTATSDVDTLDINFENDINFIPTTKDAPISFSNDNCNFKLSGKKLSTYSNDPTITVASCLNSQMPGIRVQPNQTLTLAGAGTFVVTAGNIDANLWSSTDVGRDGTYRNGNAAGIGSGGGANGHNVGEVNIIDNINVNASHGTGSYDGSQQIGSSIGCGIKSKYSGAYIPDNGMKINKITVDTTGIVNATYIGGGVIPVPVNQNNAWWVYVADFVMKSGTVNADTIGTSSYSRNYYGQIWRFVPFNFYMSGGLINTKRIGTGYCYNINNGNENSALYFNSFTQTGGTINISKDPETTYPAGIGNTYCIAGNYSINNTSSTYLSNPNSIPRTQLQSTIITKTGGTILLDGKAVDESRMFLTGMSGKLDDGSDPKYLVINS